MASYSIYITQFSRNQYNKLKPVNSGIPSCSEAVSILKACVIPVGTNVTLFSDSGKVLVNKYQFKEEGALKTGYKIFDKAALGNSIDTLRQPIKHDVAGFKNRFPSGKTYDDFKNEISIVELATSIGYNSRSQWARSKTAASYPCLENGYGDRIVIINPNSFSNQRYFNPENDSDRGDLVSFVKQRLNTDFKHFHDGNNMDKGVNSVLYDYLKLDEPTRLGNQNQYKEVLISALPTLENEDRQFIKDLFLLSPLVDTKYLQWEGIAEATIQSDVFKGQLLSVRMPVFNNEGEFLKHNTDHINTGYAYYTALNGDISGIEVRNINFKGHGLTSQKSKSVGLSNVIPKIENIFYVEGYKDALSHYELENPKNPFYIMLGGRITNSQLAVIENIIGELPLSNAVHHLSFDNDLDGSVYDLRTVAFFASTLLPDIKVAQDKKNDSIYVILKNEPNVFSFLQRFDTEISKLKNNINADLRLSYVVEGNELKISLPRSIESQKLFTSALIDTLDLQNKIRVTKSILNDFNDDLKVLKGMRAADQEVIQRINKRYLPAKNESLEIDKKKVKYNDNSQDNSYKKSRVKL